MKSRHEQSKLAIVLPNQKEDENQYNHESVIAKNLGYPNAGNLKRALGDFMLHSYDAYYEKCPLELTDGEPDCCYHYHEDDKLV